MIVLDASVMIAFLDDRDAHHRDAVDVLFRASRPAMHVVNRAEILVRGVRQGDLDELVTVIDRLGIVELERLEGEAIRLARVRAETGLKMPDSCALMAAEGYGARLATFDTRLAVVARDRRVDVLPETDA